MSVIKDPSGRRSVEIEVEVPGTPEQVWEAIATGQGVSSWFVPTEMTEQDGKTVVTSHFGPGMDAVATPTMWDPPHRFAAESASPGPDTPPIATEWIVEAREGGTCIVRIVHSLFASTDDWDNQLTGLESGWPAFFAILQLYLTHFAGCHGATIQLMGSATVPEPEAWDTLTGLLNLRGGVPGDTWTVAQGVPQLSGIVEQPGGGAHRRQYLIRLQQPTPGLAHFFALTMGGKVYLTIRLYLYGDEASTAFARDEPRWQAWMAHHFPLN